MRQIKHTSEIRITCVFGRPVAAVSYRPDDSTGQHDILYDETQTRQSTTRRVAQYLNELDRQRIESNTAPSSPDGEADGTWRKMCAVASAVAKGTDFLRVDLFFDARSGQFWLNEMDITYVDFYFVLCILLMRGA